MHTKERKKYTTKQNHISLQHIQAWGLHCRDNFGPPMIPPKKVNQTVHLTNESSME